VSRLTVKGGRFLTLNAAKESQSVKVRLNGEVKTVNAALVKLPE
jgi:hypothetical protein